MTSTFVGLVHLISASEKAENSFHCFPPEELQMASLALQLR
jgi:hypothetical protein